MEEKELLEKYGNMIYRYSVVVLKNAEDAEDVAQEVLYRYLIKRPQIKEEGELKAWFYHVAINLCKDLRKCSWYQKRSEIPATDFPSHEGEDADYGITEIIRTLPAKYSEVLFLYYYQEYSVSEIAELLKKKEGTIYSLLSRARKLLEKKLERGKKG